MVFECDKHGLFTKTPELLLNGKCGCGKCGRESAIKTTTKSYDNFLNQVNKVHGNTYKYPESNRYTYVNKKSIILVECEKHGIFRKSGQKHLSGQGCSKCGLDELIANNILVGGFNLSLFENKPELKDRSTYLYLLKIGNLYKIGITTKSVKSRVRAIRAKAKSNGDNLDIDILYSKYGTLYDCYNIEQRILDDNKSYRVYKSWSTELLSWLDISKYFNDGDKYELIKK